jgi:hypothetical protein
VHRRLLTYILNKIVKTLEIIVFLTFGLWLTGGFVISPPLIVLLLFANDFVTMSIAFDRVRPAPRPQRWRVGQLVGAAAVLAAVSLAFSLSLYSVAHTHWGLAPGQMQTMVFLLLVFTTQVNVYVLRDNGNADGGSPAQADRRLDRRRRGVRTRARPDQRHRVSSLHAQLNAYRANIASRRRFLLNFLTCI